MTIDEDDDGDEYLAYISQYICLARAHKGKVAYQHVKAPIDVAVGPLMMSPYAPYSGINFYNFKLYAVDRFACCGANSVLGNCLGPPSRRAKLLQRSAHPFFLLKVVFSAPFVD